MDFTDLVQGIRIWDCEFNTYRTVQPKILNYSGSIYYQSVDYSGISGSNHRTIEEYNHKLSEARGKQRCYYCGRQNNYERETCAGCGANL